MTNEQENICEYIMWERRLEVGRLLGTIQLRELKADKLRKELADNEAEIKRLREFIKEKRRIKWV